MGVMTHQSLRNARNLRNNANAGDLMVPARPGTRLVNGIFTGGREAAARP
jgi:hypothetical protein